MDIKKEIEEESEMLDELVNDIKRLSENGNVEIEDEPLNSASEKDENKTMKTELETDMGFNDTDVDYTLEKYDLSLALKLEDETDSYENTELDLERNSLKDEDLVAKRNEFVKLEFQTEMYQHSDDSLDIVGNDDNFFMLDYSDKPEREVRGRKGNDAGRSRNEIDKGGSDGDESEIGYREESDTELDYGNETDSYNEDDYESKLDIVIKREKADEIEQERNNDSVIDGKDQVIDYGRKTKKAKNFVCDLCSKAFTSDKRLKRHKEHLHPYGGNEDRPAKEGKYVCEVCNKRFISQSRLRLHTVTHTGEKPFSCDICGQKFSHPTNKRRHMKTHTGDKPFVCLFCGKSFPVKHYLKDHLVKHTGEKPHECKLCSMTFAHRFSLKQHELLKHPGGEMNFHNTYQDRPFACEICDKKFTQQSSLKIHVRLHTGSKPYKCTECDASFIRSDSLLRHKFEHSGQRPFQCDLCEKAFTSAYILKQHRNVHTGDRRQQCEHCGVELANKESLARHMIRHTGESLLECRTCHKKFVHEQSLKRHQEHPCEMKIYECKDCDYKNTSESKLRRHMLKHNAQKLLACKICKNKFTYPSNLKRHMKVHEKDHEMKTRRKETIISNDDVQQFIAVSMKEIENENIEEIEHTKRKSRKTRRKCKESPEKISSMFSHVDEHSNKVYLPNVKESVNSPKSIANELIITHPDFTSETDRFEQASGNSPTDDLGQNLNTDMKIKTCYTSQYGGNISMLKEHCDTPQTLLFDDINDGQRSELNERKEKYKETPTYDVEHDPYTVDRREYSPPFGNECRKNATKNQRESERYLDVFNEQKDRGVNSRALLEYKGIKREVVKGLHVGSGDTSDCSAFSLHAQEKSKESDSEHNCAHSIDTSHSSNYDLFDPKAPLSKDLYSNVTQSTYSVIPYNAALFADILPAFAGSFNAPNHSNIPRYATPSNDTSFGGDNIQPQHEDHANISTRNKMLVEDVLKKLYRHQREECDSNSNSS